MLVQYPLINAVSFTGWSRLKCAVGLVRGTWLEARQGDEWRPRMAKHSTYRYFKTSSDIVRLAVMLYARLSLSLRNVENLLYGSGVDAICHTLRCGG